MDPPSDPPLVGDFFDRLHMLLANPEDRVVATEKREPAVFALHLYVGERLADDLLLVAINHSVRRHGHSRSVRSYESPRPCILARRHRKCQPCAQAAAAVPCLGSSAARTRSATSVTSCTSSCSRTVSGTSSRSASLRFGRKTVRSPARCAARSFCFTP